MYVWPLTPFPGLVQIHQLRWLTNEWMHNTYIHDRSLPFLAWYRYINQELTNEWMHNTGHVCMCYASIHWSIILIDVSVSSQEREWAVMYVCVMHPFIGQSSWLMCLYQARKGSERSCMHVLCIHSLVNRLDWCVCTKPEKGVSGHVCMCYASIHWSIIFPSNCYLHNLMYVRKVWRYQMGNQKP
jgi:hypothetical protein